MRFTIECLVEPQLSFGGGTVGTEPRATLPVGGPAGGEGLAEIRLGLIGPGQDVAIARRWLTRLNGLVPAKEGNARRYPDWPSAARALRSKFVVDDRFVRPLEDELVEAAISGGRKGFEDLLDVFGAKIQGMCDDLRPKCIMVCLPERLADLRVENASLTEAERRALEALRSEEEESQLQLFNPTPEELKAAEELRTQADDLLFRTFYRALKARTMNYLNAVPIQVVRRDTFERPDDKGQSHATRCWNLGVSLYYKAGGIPWRPMGLPSDACYVGISFHHLKRRSGDLVYASVAQAFSTAVEPFALRGATIRHDQRRDRQPYLNSMQAESLMREVLAQYEARAGVLPSRVVLHKTSKYQPEEEHGFRVAANGQVPTCDLMWLRSTAFRLLRKGREEPLRGTLCMVGDETYLFTSGFVPRWDEYPGPHIPAPIEIGSAASTNLRERAREILVLSKMNWNSSEGMARYPITLSFAKRVGQMMTEIPESQVPNPSYRFYM